MNDDNGKTSDEIKAEIERTRSRMSEKIDTLQERLSPDHLKHQAQTVVHEAVQESTDALLHYLSANAQEMGATVVETVKRNPVPAALIGFGLGWMIFNSINGGRRGNARQNSSYLYTGHPDDRARYPRSAPDRAPYTGNPAYQPNRVPATGSALDMQYSGAYRRRDLERMEQVYTEPNLITGRREHQGVAGKVLDQVGDATQAMGSRVSEQTSRLGHRVAQAGDQAQQVGHQLQHTVGENPLMLGVAVFAVGIAVGLALPSTRSERQLVGDVRDQVVNKAQALASSVVQEVKQRAAEVTPKLEEAATKAVEDVAEIGKEAADQVKQKVRDAATAVQQKAEELQTGEKTPASASAYA